MSEAVDINFQAILPELVLTGTALLLLLTAAVARRGLPAVVVVFMSGVGLVTSLALVIWLRGNLLTAFAGMIVLDDFALFFDIILIIGALITVFFSLDYLERERLLARFPEYCCLLLLSCVGAMVMVSAGDLVTVFLGIDTLSLALYVLTGYASQRPYPTEAALKYLLLGAMASGFLVYGVAFVYGATGTTNLGDIGTRLAGKEVIEEEMMVFAYVGLGLLLIGLSFKIALVPFHQWAPDVYDGALTPMAAFMATAPKVAAVGALFRVMWEGFRMGEMFAAWNQALWVIAVLTMTFGNLTALAQSNVKRMLAYSSVAHAGYLLVGMIPLGEKGIAEDAAASVLFYGLVYTLMTIGAFGIVMLLDKDGGVPVSLEECSGLASRHPWLAFGMLVFMVSLTGIPPTAGFMGKLMLFSAAVKAGYIGLVVIAVLNSVVSAYFYLRVAVMMFMHPPRPKTATPASFPNTTLAIAACVLLTIYLGFLPARVLELAQEAVRGLF